MVVCQTRKRRPPQSMVDPFGDCRVVAAQGWFRSASGGRFVSFAAAPRADAGGVAAPGAALSPSCSWFLPPNPRERL